MYSKEHFTIKRTPTHSQVYEYLASNELHAMMVDVLPDSNPLKSFTYNLFLAGFDKEVIRKSLFAAVALSDETELAESYSNYKHSNYKHHHRGK